MSFDEVDEEEEEEEEYVEVQKDAEDDEAQLICDLHMFSCVLISVFICASFPFPVRLSFSWKGSGSGQITG